MIYIGSDHRGYEMKEKVKHWLDENDYDYEDVGPLEYNKDDDYPDFAEKVGDKVASDIGSRGILICGSGVGIDVAANKIDGVRAGTISDPKQVQAAVHDEDLNVISLSADFLSEEKAEEIVKAFLETHYEKTERYERRLDKIEDLESEN